MTPWGHGGHGKWYQILLRIFWDGVSKYGMMLIGNSGTIMELCFEKI
jgi:hypothetical protein